MKASDIADERIYELVAAARRSDGEPSCLMLLGVRDALQEFPEAVVYAKLRQMIAKGRLRGCPCGCRGDFRFPWEEFGLQSEESRANWREKIAEYLAGPRVYGY
jgi:hypothetical protein